MAIAVGPEISDGVWLSTYVYTLPTVKVTTTTGTGSTGAQSYSASPIIKAKLEKNTARKIGVMISVYEPDVLALLGGEI